MVLEYNTAIPTACKYGKKSFPINSRVCYPAFTVIRP